MPKFHINPKTGNPAACRAAIQCPFGDAEKDHWGSKAEAREAYEARNANGVLSGRPKSETLSDVMDRLNLRLTQAQRDNADAKALASRLQAQIQKLEKNQSKKNVTLRGIADIRTAKLANEEQAQTLSTLEATVKAEAKTEAAELTELRISRSDAGRNVNTTSVAVKEASEAIYMIETAAGLHPTVQKPEQPNSSAYVYGGNKK